VLGPSLTGIILRLDIWKLILSITMEVRQLEPTSIVFRAVDICSAWVECVPLLAKSQELVTEALEVLR